MMTGIEAYGDYDGLGLAELVRRREVTPRDLVEEAIDRIERVNPQLNAVIHKMYDLSLEAAEGQLPDGSFTGVPFLLKDLTVAYSGVPLRGGSKFLNEFVPDYDNELVKRFKTAGLIVVGKTNTPELGLWPVTEPELYGPTNNPWDLARTPGGSSGGSASAVSARIVPMAHGNDGGGSIRIPASCCGLFGLKPSRGRNPAGPILSENFHGLASDHVLTRTVRDSAAVLDATSGPDLGAPYYLPPPARPFLDEVTTESGPLRIAFVLEPFLADSVHEDCLEGLKLTVKLCEDLGHQVEEATLEIDGKEFNRAFVTMVYGSVWAQIQDWEALLGRKASYRYFEPETWAVNLLGSQLSAGEFSQADRYLKGLGRQLAQFFAEFDILLTPTLAMPPLQTGELVPKGLEALGIRLLGRLNAGGVLQKIGAVDIAADTLFDFIPYTPLFNATGQPAMSVPLYWNEEGLPIGMHFAARYGEEALLFRLAGQLERAMPWIDRIPPISA